MNAKNILIIKPSSLGDIIHTFPSVVLIASEMPHVNIDWLIHRNFIEILHFLPPVRKAIPFPRKELGRVFSFLPTFLKLRQELRKEKYDVVIDFQGLLRSSLLAKCCRCREVVGFADPREKISKMFYTRSFLPPDEYKHAVERNLFLVSQALDIEYQYYDFDLPEHFKHTALIEEMLSERGIHENDITIGIVPGARWQTKRWPPEFFAEIMNRIIEYNYKIKFILIGDDKDLPIAEKIVDRTSEKNVISCIGETNIGELVELIRKCCYLLTNDSGPMHIGAALGIPTFALFGPTDPERCGPYGMDNVIFQSDLNCIKCYKRECKRTDNCQKNIAPSMVAEHIIMRLEEDFE